MSPRRPTGGGRGAPELQTTDLDTNSCEPSPAGKRPRFRVEVEEDDDADSASPSGTFSVRHAYTQPSGRGSLARRRLGSCGLSAEEKNCFKKAGCLVPSPRAQERLSCPDGRLLGLGGGEAARGTPDTQLPPRTLSGRSRCRPNTNGRNTSKLSMASDKNHLDAEAEQVAEVLVRIYPSIREEGGPSNKSGSSRTTSPPKIPKSLRANLMHATLSSPALGVAGAVTPKPPASAASKGLGRSTADKGGGKPVSASTADRGSVKPVSAMSGSSGGAVPEGRQLARAAAASAAGGGRGANKDADEEAEAPAIEASMLKKSLGLLRREKKLGDTDGFDMPLSQLAKDADTTRPMFDNAILMSKFNPAAGKRNAGSYSLQIDQREDAETNRGSSKMKGLWGFRKAARKVELMNSLGDSRTGPSPSNEDAFSLRRFRQRLLQKWGSVHEAFNRVDSHSSQELDPHEWEKAMVTAGICNNREAALMFDVLDADGNGQVTVTEFQLGLETIAPINNMESFRKRLICLGFRTMMQAVKVMESALGQGTVRLPLSFPEFSNAMRRVYVYDLMEQKAIYEAVRDPMDDTGKVSVGDVAAALSMVSPSFLVEELRERVLQRNSHGQEIWQSLFQWGGAEHEISPEQQQLLDRWWTAKRYKDNSVADALLSELRSEGLDPEVLRPPGTELGEFVTSTVNQLGFSPIQAQTAFRLVDLDGNEELEMWELISAMNLAMPCISLEEIRKIVRQRHRSIHAALANASEKQYKGAPSLDDTAKFASAEVAIFLEPLDIKAKDVRRLFRLIDTQGDGYLSLLRFFKGIKLFAPSCVLDGLRLQLLANHRRVADAFRSDTHHDRTDPLYPKDVDELLQRLGVEVPDIGPVFDCLDARSVGTVTITELIAAFQNLNAGNKERTTSHECERKAERSVRAELAGVRKNVSELKTNVRQGLDDEPSKPGKAGDMGQGKRLGGGSSRRDKNGRGEYMPRLPQDSAELAQVQYEARKMLGKVVSAPELRQAPLERGASKADDSSKGSRLELPRLVKDGSGAHNELAQSTGKLGGSLKRASFAHGAYDRIHRNLEVLPRHHKQHVQISFIEPLSGYFSSATETMEEHLPLFEVRRKRGELHSEITKHIKEARLRIKS